MAKKFIDLHRGWIEVNSAEGKGSVFTVELPNQIQQQETQQPSETMRPATPGGRIILVEDDEETANLMCDMLTAAGYQVIWTVDVSTAAEQTRLLQPEVVIVDVDQPTQDRLAMIRHLRRQRPDASAIKVLIMGTAGQISLPTTATEVDAYLTKPVDPQYLIHRVIDFWPMNLKLWFREGLLL